MQKEFFGRGSALNISALLEEIGAKNILLVTGKNSYKDCGAKDFFESELSKFNISNFNSFSPNPKFEEAMAGVVLCRQRSIDAIVAIGGGSAIDIAKCVSAFNDSPGLERQLATGEKKLDSPPLPVVAIPTTAGTGSEATHFAVIYVEGKKYSLASPALMPSAAIIDPVFTDNLPPYLTACTGFDALCQSIESFWAVGSTIESRENAKQAIQLLMESLATAVNAPDNASRDSVLRAANFAGKAINVSKTTAPHAISYPITSYFGVPHGHAVALTLGKFFMLNKDDSSIVNDGRGREHLLEIMDELSTLLGAKEISECECIWRELMRSCGLEVAPSKLGIKAASAIQKITSNVNVERLQNHPIKLTPQQIEALFSDSST